MVGPEAYSPGGQPMKSCTSARVMPFVIWPATSLVIRGFAFARNRCETITGIAMKTRSRIRRAILVRPMVRSDQNRTIGHRFPAPCEPKLLGELNGVFQV